MAYQSLYRKWRPQTFAAMVGQEHVARTLANAVRVGRMAHAYLFTGPRGTGKTSAARLFAKALNCQERADAEPCDHCASCVAIREGRSLDVLEIDGASNRGIDEIRDLRERVGMAPSSGPYRFYIIDEVHQLTEAAFNALLKTLEEPPAHVVFILATTDAHKVPATISSRCQHFAFHRISAEGLRARLTLMAETEGFSIEPAALEQLVEAADGSLRDGQSLLDQAVAFCGPTISAADLAQMLGLAPRAMVEEFAGYLRDCDAAAAVQAPGRVADAGVDLRQFHRQLLDYLRAVLAARAQGRPEAAGWELPHLLRTIRLFAAIDFSARLNTIAPLPLELAAVEACTAPAEPAVVGAAAAPHAAMAPNGNVAAPVRPATSPAGPAPTRPAHGARAAAPEPAPRDDGVLQTPAASTPPPFERDSGVAASVPDDVRRQWERVLASVRRTSPRVQAACNSGQLLGIDGNALVLSVRPGMEFIQEQLSAPKAREVVETAIREVFGEDLAFRCEVEDAARAAPAAPRRTTPPRADRAPAAPDEGGERQPPAPARSSRGPKGSPSAADPARDLHAEASNNPTVRMALDAFGARIESVKPANER